MSIYIYVCLVYLVIKCYKLPISFIYKVMFVRLLELLKIAFFFRPTSELKG